MNLNFRVPIRQRRLEEDGAVGGNSLGDVFLSDLLRLILLVVSGLLGLALFVAGGLLRLVLPISGFLRLGSHVCWARCATRGCGGWLLQRTAIDGDSIVKRLNKRDMWGTWPWRISAG